VVKNSLGVSAVVLTCDKEKEDDDGGGKEGEEE
jgi:hypothetical protein